MENTTLEQELLEQFEFNGDENLMNPSTGSVDTAESWACEAINWSESEEEIYEQFGDLVEVIKDQNDNWVEA